MKANSLSAKGGTFHRAIVTLAFMLNTFAGPTHSAVALPDSDTLNWNASNPVIDIAFSGDNVIGHDWPSNTPVTLTVDEDVDPGNGFLFQQTKSVDPYAGDPSLGSVTFSLGKNTNTIYLFPGQYIELDNGTVSKTTQIYDVSITSVNDVTDVIQGQGPANRPASIYVGTAGGDSVMDITIDNDGNWFADFTTVSFDMQNVLIADAHVFDEDGDSTGVFYQIPSMLVDPNHDIFDLYWWPLYSTATVEMDDPSDGIGDVDFSTTVYIDQLDETNWALKNETGESLDLSNVFDIKPGVIIRVTEPSTPTKVHTVAGFTDFDSAADVVTGLAEAGALVNIQACLGSNCSNRHVNADGSGIWVADFSQPGNEPDEQDTFNIIPDTWLNMEQVDIDRDSSWHGQCPPAFIISGNVGAPRASLTYVIDGIMRTVLSDQTGNYLIRVSEGWSGTVTPSKQCSGRNSLTRCYFIPAKRIYVNVTSNITRQNYVLKRVY